MSGKCYNQLDDPVINSSSEEDNVDSHESSKTPSLKNSKSSEKSDSDSESETNSDSEPEKNNRVVTNPGSGTQDSIKVSKSSIKSVVKRSSSKIDGGAASADAKRVKRVSGEEEEKNKSGGVEETKNTYFQRVWTEEDEIAVLQGLIDYKNETGVSPYDNTNGVYQMVKKSISFDVSKTQFMEKLRSLKKTYENNVGNAKKGVEPTFAKSHDHKAFDLAKLIWGAKGFALESALKSNGKSKKSSTSKKVESLKQEFVSSLRCEDEVNVMAANEGEVSLPDPAEMDKFAKSLLVKSLARFGLDDLAAQQGWSKLAVEDKKRFEEQWKALKLREFEFYSQKSGFIHEVVTKMAETFRSYS